MNHRSNLWSIGFLPGNPKLLGGFAVLVLLLSTGCVQMAANLINVIRGPSIPAEFKGLEKKNVAVVCRTENGVLADEPGIRLAGNVRGILAQNLPKTKFVMQEEIDRWLHGKGGGDDEFIDIAKGVKCDYLIAIEMQNLRIKDGATLYRGKSDVSLAVYETSSGKIVFRKSLPDYTYPLMAGVSTTESDDDRFRRAYLLTLAGKLSRFFYAHEIGQDMAIDATILNF